MVFGSIKKRIREEKFLRKQRVLANIQIRRQAQTERLKERRIQAIKFAKEREVIRGKKLSLAQRGVSNVVGAVNRSLRDARAAPPRRTGVLKRINTPKKPSIKRRKKRRKKK